MLSVSRWAGRRLGFPSFCSVRTDTTSIKKIKNMVLKVQGFVLSLSEGKTLLLWKDGIFYERTDTKRRIRHFC